MTDDQLQLHFMLKLKSPELSAVYKRLDSVHNLNYNPIDIRCAGHEGMRLAFLAGVRFAQSPEFGKDTQ